MDVEDVTTAAKEVFDLLGTGHTEIVYETAMELELWERSQFTANIRRQVPCPIYYKGYLVGTGYIDLLINDDLIVELKVINRLTNKEEAQVKKYLAGRKANRGVLVNFSPLGDLEVVKLCGSTD